MKLITFEVCVTRFGGRQVVIFVILAYHGLRAALRAIKSVKVLDRWIDDSKRYDKALLMKQMRYHLRGAIYELCDFFLAT